MEELTASHEDVRYLRNAVTMPVQSEAAQDAAINTLSAPITRLEKKLGLVH